MKYRYKNILEKRLFAGLLAVICLAACARPVKTVGLNELFTLKSGETVNIQGTALNLKMVENGTGKTQSGDDDSFCKVEVTFKGVTEPKTVSLGSFIAYEQLNIRVEKVNVALDITKMTCVFSVAKTMG